MPSKTTPFTPGLKSGTPRLGTMVFVEDRLAIRAAVTSLPPHYQFAVRTRIWDGMDMELAGIASLEAGYVRPGANATKAHDNHYWRALKVLREQLKPELPLLGA